MDLSFPIPVIGKVALSTLKSRSFDISECQHTLNTCSKRSNIIDGRTIIDVICKLFFMPICMLSRLENIVLKVFLVN